ncbi:hypothetical protein [Amaricoccus sp.]|uniref:hypothetical protein n=1 Tax=Amaricoccus sp. TaxID=1872485 RepID=UPI001B7BF4AF|nr:hypothetical protein [Amaricoccus sp.]MBP7002296.1 hypothetical protein [Amaricoccus sp.]
MKLEEDAGLSLSLEAFSDPGTEPRLLVDLVGGRIKVDGADQSVSGQAFNLHKLLLKALPEQSWISSAEPRRVSRRLQRLRDWSHGDEEDGEALSGRVA